MPKKLFLIFFSILIIITSIFSPISVSAYEVTEFDISAKAGILVSLDTGKVLYENNTNEKLYPASITKIMTTILILESDKYNADEKISMTKSAMDLVLGTGSSVSTLKEGETFSQLDLVHLVLMASAGDVTYLAAEYYGGSVENFVEMMNNKAKELGLKGTHYQNPVGLHDPENYTTVNDIRTLTEYALKNETFKEICAKKRYTMPATNMSGERTLSTTNFLQDNTTNYYYQYAKVVKTGYTDEAGRCLVSTASYNGYNYLCILMGCPANKGRRYEFLESASLYRWAFNNFSYKKVANSNEPVCEVPVKLSLETDFVPLYFKQPFVTVLPNEANDSTFVIKPNLKSETVEAPIKKGQVLGTADIIYAEEVIGTVDLVANDNIEAFSILKIGDSILKFFKSKPVKYIGLALIIIIVLAILIYILMCVYLNYGRIKKRKVRYMPYKKGEFDDKE